MILLTSILPIPILLTRILLTLTCFALPPIDDGDVYSFGRLDNFAVGLGPSYDHPGDVLNVATRPQSLRVWHRRLDRTGSPTMGSVAKIAAGRNISCFLTHDGEVWTW